MKNSLKFGLALWCVLTVAAALLTYVYFTMPKKDEELGFAAGMATLGWCFMSAVMMRALDFTDEDEAPKEKPKETIPVTPPYIWVQKTTKEVPSETDEK